MCSDIYSCGGTGTWYESAISGCLYMKVEQAGYPEAIYYFDAITGMMETVPNACKQIYILHACRWSIILAMHYICTG